ncbi:MAG: hypothetical protein PHU56_03235 [Candidatus Pacebacteria bacterium]|nr:hypothetical protein [Candidatus Paceibacterota bacterium]
MAVKKRTSQKPAKKKAVKPIKKALAEKKKAPATKAKKIVKKTAKKEILAGRIVHYFDKIKVAVIKLNVPLSLGDDIRISGGADTDFKQKVQSMQIDHQAIKKAAKGQEIGIKTKEAARDGYRVYKI